MKYLWGLTHILQLFRIIILINIVIPKLVIQLCSYFEVAVGEFDLISDLLPSVLTKTILNPNELMKDSLLLQDKFEQNYDIHSPYLILEFEKAIVYGGAIVVLSVIILFGLGKITK